MNHDHPGPAAPEGTPSGPGRGRAADLDGVDVLGSDGALVGRTRDIYLNDRGRELTAITVVFGHLNPRGVLIPAGAFAEDPLAVTRREHTEPIRLAVDKQTARAGLAPPDTLHATPEQLREAARALGVEEGPVR